MDNDIQHLLRALVDGTIPVEEAAAKLRWADQAMPFATIDHDRARRCGSAEVVYAAGKTATQVVAIARAIVERAGCALVTRATDAHADAVADAFEQVETGSRRGTLIIGAPPEAGGTTIPIVTAGTSDEPVAEEAELTCRAMGQATRRISDVGVAGMHRIMERADELRRAGVIIVIAGMEGALPSVVSGLVDVPVIGVPTSVGYGVGAGGYAALMGMLSSCATGVTVVNIDNGFGAAHAATLIQRQIDGAGAER